MAISNELRGRVEDIARELRKDLWGAKGYPPWGTKFVEMEEKTADLGDALACVLLAQTLQEQAEQEGHAAGKCGGCGEPIPLEELAVRLLQSKRGEAAWQESYGACTRCRKSFFPSLPSFGNCAR
jgi:hypothetical protein